MGKTVAAIVGIVVAVAIAVAAPYLAPFVATALSVSTAVATAIVTIGLSVAAMFAFKALGIGALSVPKAKDQVGPPTVFRQSVTNSFIVYGKRRVGGLLVFFHSRQSGSDHYRYFVIAVAGHRCKQVDNWRLSDEIVTVDGSNMVTSGKYASAAWLWFQRGLASETANATFVSECGGNWTTNHKGNGVAAIYAKFKLTDPVIQAGMPNITADIEGRDEILDTRTATQGYTANAALVFYDWLQIAREEGGFGAYPDEIPDTTWINAQANVCDEVVSSENRYELNAVITTGAAPSEVRDAMVVNQAGTYTYSGGKHLMRPGYWVIPSVTLSEDDLAGPIQVSPFLTSDAAANEIQGTYINPADGYQGAPFTTQSAGASDIRQVDLDLSFTTSLKQADRVARIMLGRAQCEKTVLWPGNINLLDTRALDTVQVDKTDYALNNYAWVVSNWGLSSDYGVVLSLREENASIYTDGTPATPSTPPTIVQPTGPLNSSTPTIGDPPQSLNFNYDYTGAPIDLASGATRDLTFPLLINGSAVGSGVSWNYTIINGGINGKTSADGPQAMSGSGMGTLTVSSLESSLSVVRISAAYNGATVLKDIRIGKAIASASSGGAAPLFSKASGFAGFSTTTFVSQAGAMNFTTPSGVTAVNVNVNLDATAVPGSGGSWTVEARVMLSGVQKGSTQSKTSQWVAADSSANPASFGFSIPITGLSGSTAYAPTLEMRITSGTRSHTVTAQIGGGVTITV